MQHFPSQGLSGMCETWATALPSAPFVSKVSKLLPDSPHKTAVEAPRCYHLFLLRHLLLCVQSPFTGMCREAPAYQPAITHRPEAGGGHSHCPAPVCWAGKEGKEKREIPAQRCQERPQTGCDSWIQSNWHSNCWRRGKCFTLLCPTVVAVLGTRSTEMS